MDRGSTNHSQRALVLLIALVCLVPLLGCSKAAWQRAAQGAALGASAATQSAPAKLMLFGGENHRTYVGCLNCSEYSTDSVFNKYGQHGSEYSTESIWNHYGDYGSAYSSYGVCNRYATDPPVIVDSAGTFYGRLTLNAYHAQIGIGRNYMEWLSSAVCQ